METQGGDFSSHFPSKTAFCYSIAVILGFPGGKESTCNAGDVSSIPGLGRSPGGGHGNSLRCSCLENPHGQRSLVGYSPWGHKESDTTERLSTQLSFCTSLGRGGSKNRPACAAQHTESGQGNSSQKQESNALVSPRNTSRGKWTNSVSIFKNFIFIYFHRMACGILVP